MDKQVITRKAVQFDVANKNGDLFSLAEMNPPFDWFDPKTGQLYKNCHFTHTGRSGEYDPSKTFDYDQVSHTVVDVLVPLGLEPREDYDLDKVLDMVYEAQIPYPTTI